MSNRLMKVYPELSKRMRVNHPDELLGALHVLSDLFYEQTPDFEAEPGSMLDAFLREGKRRAQLRDLQLKGRVVESDESIYAGMRV